MWIRCIALKCPTVFYLGRFGVDVDFFCRSIRTETLKRVTREKHGNSGKSQKSCK